MKDFAMSFRNIVIAVAIFTAILMVRVESKAAGKTWYAGAWDSTFYPLAEHPKTIAIRMELIDKDTHTPVSDVNVTLKGQYYQTWISRDIAKAESKPWWKIFVDPNKREPQSKEFKLEAVSDSNGVVVFALKWQKEFPWESKIVDKWTSAVGERWFIYLDDVEKVQRLEIRHPRYKHTESPLDFRHLVDLKQYIDASQRGEDKNRKFEDNWKNEISRRDVKLFVLDLGAGFAEYNKQFCSQPEFFRKVRAKDYGVVYEKSDNLPKRGDGTKCGPYFVYDLGGIFLEPVSATAEQTSVVGEREKSIDLGSGIRMEFVLIPAGSFNMGSPSTEKDRDSDEGPVRRVQITKPFYMSKYEVTQEQYTALISKNPSSFSGRNLPVDSVSWKEAVEFCSKLGSGFRLPTEAEWEYACRAGSETRFFYGDDPNYSQLDKYAWYRDNSDRMTQAVGQKKPNSFGLYDMHGNVWEWCADWYADSLIKTASIDPTGPASGETRVLRGGSWYCQAGLCRSANRLRRTPGYLRYGVGFRVVLELK